MKFVGVITWQQITYTGNNDNVSYVHFIECSQVNITFLKYNNIPDIV